MNSALRSLPFVLCLSDCRGLKLEFWGLLASRSIPASVLLVILSLRGKAELQGPKYVVRSLAQLMNQVALTACGFRAVKFGYALGGWGLEVWLNPVRSSDPERTPRS